ncbi:MAG: esterase/lipase family protein [Roseburia sp.]
MKKVAMAAGEILLFLIEAALIFAISNCVMLHIKIRWQILLWLLFVAIQIYPSVFLGRWKSGKLRNSAAGCLLLGLFLTSTTASIIYNILILCGSLPGRGLSLVFNILLVFLVELVVFWNGIIRIYVASEQLGIRWRVLGAVCGMIPVVHLIVLGKLLYVVISEIRFENNKILTNEARSKEQICATKYPILLVHGVFFRDFRYLNYWGRIPKELEINGARIFYGNHQSAASVADSAQELAERIRQIKKETGCEKVNIIAHSKGGLDCRYAIAKCGMDQDVASLTTINTPHRGCEFADYLLTKIPQKQQRIVANGYEAVLKRLGDPNPDFLKAVYDLTASRCKQMNEEVKDVPGVFYQSIGSKLNVASGGRFPLNFSYRLVNSFDGANDGLVGEKSFPWGQEFRMLRVSGKRGISHGDMIDLNRENIKAFDVREFYVELVSDLKKRGY